MESKRFFCGSLGFTPSPPRMLARHHQDCLIFTSWIKASFAIGILGGGWMQTITYSKCSPTFTSAFLMAEMKKHRHFGMFFCTKTAFYWNIWGFQPSSNSCSIFAINHTWWNLALRFLWDSCKLTYSEIHKSTVSVKSWHISKATNLETNPEEMLECLGWTR